MTILKARCLGGLKAAIAATLLVAVTAAPAMAQSQGEFVVTKMAEKTVSELPEGELYWYVETFASLDAAKAAGGDFSLETEFRRQSLAIHSR